MNTIDETLLKKDREMHDGDNNAETNNLRDLLIAELKSIYWAEKELINAIPKMAQKASSENLKTGLMGHLEETKEHVKRIEKIFIDEFDLQPEAKKCEALAGMVKEAEELIEKSLEGSVRDAAIIAEAQKVEHYEIATYGTLLAFAHTIGEKNVAELLESTLREEHKANDKLTNVGNMVNVEADRKKMSEPKKIQY